jgi:hypothetical protein
LEEIKFENFNILENNIITSVKLAKVTTMVLFPFGFPIKIPTTEAKIKKIVKNLLTPNNSRNG